MDNPSPPTAEALILQLRAELQRRKKLVEPPFPEPPSSTAPISIPALHVSPKAESRLARAWQALERARSKNIVSSILPPFLRSFRRNQGAVNDSLLNAIKLLLDGATVIRENVELLANATTTLHQQMAAQSGHAAAIAQNVQQRDADLMAQAKYLDGHQKQLSILRHTLENCLRDGSERDARAYGQKKDLAEARQQIRELALYDSVQDERVELQHGELVKLSATFSGFGEQSRAQGEEVAEQRRQLLVLIQSFEGQPERENVQDERIETQQKQLDASRQVLAEQGEHGIVQDRRIEEQQRQIAELRDTFSQKESESTRQSAILAELERTTKSLMDRRVSIDELLLLRDKVNALQVAISLVQKFVEHAPPPEPASGGSAVSLGDQIKALQIHAFYLAFENQFRGSRAQIKERVQFYLPFLDQARDATGAATALDVGCGRGEWLEVLRENGYEARGVDLNVCMVRECESYGLPATEADGIAYLRDLPSASLSTISGFHIVEHLSFAQLFDLFQEALRVLRPGGIAIFETPNPECLKVSTYNFFLDPTHRNPIPQELLCFAASHAGFAGIRVERLHPYSEGGVFQGYGDYAGIFTR